MQKNYVKVKTDYKNSGIFYGFFPALKIKYCSPINEYGNIEEHKNFNNFTFSQKLLDRVQYSDMLKGNKFHAKPTLSWEKSIDSGIVIPKKGRYCTECWKILFVVIVTKKVPR